LPRSGPTSLESFAQRTSPRGTERHSAQHQRLEADRDRLIPARARAFKTAEVLAPSGWSKRVPSSVTALQLGHRDGKTVEKVHGQHRATAQRFRQ
jgi:hypothetical protein